MKHFVGRIAAALSTLGVVVACADITDPGAVAIPTIQIEVRFVDADGQAVPNVKGGAFAFRDIVCGAADEHAWHTFFVADQAGWVRETIGTFPADSVRACVVIRGEGVVNGSTKQVTTPGDIRTFHPSGQWQDTLRLQVTLQ